MRAFDPKHPISSFKALVLNLIKEYHVDVECLYLKSGTIRSFSRQAAVVGKVLEVSIREYLSCKRLQTK